MKTKLSDLVKSTGRTGADVSYAWHRASGNNKKLALVISLSGEVLDQARYRAGDKADVEFGDTDMTILLGDSYPFSCCNKSKSRSSRHLKVSAEGISTVEAVLPNVGTTTELNVIQVSVGKIRVRLPAGGQI